MEWRHWVSWLAVGSSLGLGGCTGSKTGDAVVATAVTVAAVGVNRALTRECWASCSPGYICNRKSGLCVPGECVPACVEPNQCTLVGSKLMCVPASRTVVQGIIPGTPYHPTAAADLANREASVPPGTQANPPASYAGHSERGKTLIRKATGCARPGSQEWYAETDDAKDLGSVSGDLHRDLVGVWSTEENALGVSRAIVVTPSFVEQGTRRPYDVLDDRDGRLLIRAYPPLTGVSGAEFEVRFVDRHHIDFGGIHMKRYDCRSDGPHAELCCHLPRARWVLLGPG